MATSLSTTLKLALTWVHKNSLDLGDVKDSNSLSLEDALTDGNGLDEAEELWHDRRTLATSTVENLDLAGVLANAFGQTVAFTRVKAIAVRNRATAAGASLLVGGGDDGAGNNAFASWLDAADNKVAVAPGGVLLLWNPSAAAYAVTAGTGDVLRVENTSGSDAVEYDVVIVGTKS